MIALNSQIKVEMCQSDEWDSLVQSFARHTVFHLSPWLKVVEAAHRARPVCAAAFERGNCVAVFPMLKIRKALWRIAGSPLPGWSTPYLGPLFQRDVIDRHRVIDAFLRHPEFRGASYFACKILEDGEPLDLQHHQFTPALHYDTYRLSLAPDVDELWSNLRRECRNHIRKAQKLGVEVRAEPNGEFLEDYWAMSVETFAKAGVHPTHDEQFVQQMWRHLHPAGMLNALSAFHDGQRVATIMLLNDCHTMYYWGGAAFLKQRHLPAHNLLQWEGICLAKRAGRQTYDFISTTGGPGKFKQSFGPERQFVATHWERSSSRVIGLMKKHYEAYLRRRQRRAHSIVQESESPSNTQEVAAK